MTHGEPIITIKGLRNSFGEQVIHDDLDLDVRIEPARDRVRPTRIDHAPRAREAVPHRRATEITTR